MRPPVWLLVSALIAALSGASSRALAGDARALGHDAALRLAAERNIAVLVASLERDRLGAVAEAARRPYLPELAVESAGRNTGGERNAAIEATAKLTYLSPYGQSLTATGSTSAGLAGNPENQSALSIELSQALLRGGYQPGGAADLRQADLDVKIAREQLRARLNDLLSSVDRAYWNLVFAREDVEVKRRSRDRARAQYDETRENIKRGLLAPGEIYVVEENVVNFDDGVSRAEENLALAESALRRLLVLPPGTAIEATSPIAADDASEPALAESLEAAAAHNPVVLAARLTAERAKVGISLDERRAMPQLDAFGSLSVAAGRDQLAQPLPSDPTVRTGLRLSIPLTRGPDAARVRRARAEYAQRSLAIQDAEADAGAAVSDALTRLRARRDRLDMASRLVDLAQKKLDVQRDKYKSGLATLPDVVRFQRDLDTALSNELRARVDVLTARTDLYAARGDLHERLKVSVR
ncbi:MAG: TolC family protein [Byssovorax sp.]